MKSFLAIFLIATITLSGCAWFDKSSYEKITGEYFVGWDDMVQNRSINKPAKDCPGCFDIVVGEYVYAVGHNDDFIIAKRHFGTNTTKTYYYIIDIKKNKNETRTTGVYEFSNTQSFDSLRNLLSISHLSFDMNYPEKS